MIKQMLPYVAFLVLIACNKKNENIVDKDATMETKALLSALKSIPEKGIMFGQQDATLYGVGWKYEENRADVKSVCGDYPAVYGWELGGIELKGDKSLDSVPFATLRRHIVEAYKRGGVNTVSWHAYNPVTGNDSWHKDVNGAVQNILPNGVMHDKYKLALDKLADFFLSLKDEKGVLVPILFRPFHEHTGSWFWWGKDHCTAQEYKDLFAFTVTYLRDVKQVHNLLYIYSPAGVKTEAEYTDRYPSDEYIDILGVDYYRYADNYKEETKVALDIVQKLSVEKNKVMVFSETGYESIKDPKWWTSVLLPSIKDYPLAYVLVWRNAHDKVGHYYAPYPGQVSADDFIEFKKSGKVLFQKDVPKMY